MEVELIRDTHTINSIEELEELYGLPNESALKKQTSFIVEPGRAFIEASPFLILATASENGVDCSPKGDAPGFVHLFDENILKTIPMWYGFIIFFLELIQSPCYGCYFIFGCYI